MIELTKDQHDALIQNGDQSPKVYDPLTQTEYVLLRSDLYERLRCLFDDDFQVSDAYPAIGRALAELWSDPKMDDYDRYEEFKK